jgi:flagellar basal body-associated protein FliL
MSNNTPNSNEDQEPLSPEAEAVIKRARRSFGVSMIIMLVGFMAVAGALVYRVTQNSAANQYQAQTIALPQGAVVKSAVAQSGTITLTLEVNGEAMLRIVDAKSGLVLQDVRFSPELAE